MNLPRLFKKGGHKRFNIKLGKSEKVHGGLFPEEVENNRNKKFFQPMEIKQYNGPGKEKQGPGKNFGPVLQAPG